MAQSEIQHVFASYCAGGLEEMDGRSFAKLCKDCSLIDKSFSARDADLVFAKAVGKGQRRVGLAEFELALVFIAERRGCKGSEVFQMVADAHPGPALNGTKPHAVRFHDDKDTYTGTHARGGPETVPKGIGHLPQVQASQFPSLLEAAGGVKRSSSRPTLADGSKAGSKVRAAGEGFLAPPPTPNLLPSRSSSRSSVESRSSSRPVSPCSQLGLRDGTGSLLEVAFENYSLGRDMDGKSFAKVLKDSRLLDRKLTAGDVDIIFVKAAGKGQRRIDLQQFRSALILIAEKKGVDGGIIFEAVCRQAAGPQLVGTKTEAVRFHDDKNTYTGVHVNGGPDSVPTGRGTSTQLAGMGMRYAN